MWPSTAGPMRPARLSATSRDEGRIARAGDGAAATVAGPATCRRSRRWAQRPLRVPGSSCQNQPGGTGLLGHERGMGAVDPGALPADEHDRCRRRATPGSSCITRVCGPAALAGALRATCCSVTESTAVVGLEHEDGGVGGQRPGQGDPLALPTGEEPAPFAEVGARLGGGCRPPGRQPPPPGPRPSQPRPRRGATRCRTRNLRRGPRRGR